MPAPVECVPGPQLSCLNGTADQTMFLLDLGAGLVARSYEQDMVGNVSWLMHADGEVTPGGLVGPRVASIS